MARRKHTTARPEKIPMKTERMRKKTSSWKTPSRLANKRCVVRSRTTDGAGVPSAERGVEARSLIEWPPHVFAKSEVAPSPDLVEVRRQKQFAARSGTQGP